MPETTTSTSSAPETTHDPTVPIDPGAVEAPASGNETSAPAMKRMSAGQRFLVTGFSFAALLGPGIYVLTYLHDNRLNQETTLGTVLVLACLLGAAMGALHGLASIAAHSGGQRLGASWVLFYFIRPFSGAGIALATCLVLVSGIGGFKVDWKQDALTLFAWAALAGLYSQPAMEKLKELFSTLFRTADKNARGRRPAGAGGAGRQAPGRTDS